MEGSKMPLYMFAVRGRRVKFPLRAVVTISQGVVKVRVRTSLWDGVVRAACTVAPGTAESGYGVNMVTVLFWKEDGTLVSQTNVTQDGTEISIPSGTAYVEWRVPPNAVFTSNLPSGGGHIASVSLTITIMSFIDEAGNITNINVNLIFICSGYDRPISVISAELPINIDIPFCNDCSGDFSVRSALRGIYATIKNSQNAKLQAVLLDGNKTVLATCPEQAVGNINTDTEIYLCPDNDQDLVGYLKTFYPDTRYIRVKVDKSNPDGPLPAVVFTIYFSVDKGSIP